MRGRVLLVLAATAALLLGGMALAAEREVPALAAEQTDSARVEADGADAAALIDGLEETYTRIPAGGSVTITAEEGIGSLYVIFDRIYGEWILSGGEEPVTCGRDGFLHEFVDVETLLGGTPRSVTMTFPEGACALGELHVFTSGQAPDWVQIWQPPCEEADLLLFSTHVDDEQLYFAGVLPYYAGEKGLAVQVAYFTDPFSYHDRPHEQLNGLWTVGVRHYPVCGPYPDLYSEDAETAYAQQARRGYSKDDIVRSQAELLRRFKPYVVVGHDINGEYGHGQHRVNSQTLMEALDLAADENYDPDTVALYGVWDTPKAYIHLWKENPLVMDWDVPLEAFGGKTAFQVTQDGFHCHKSQHKWSGFVHWIYGWDNEITKASQISVYSPCRYGLFRTTVGLDEAGGDMFENIPMSYAEIAAEKARREEERLRAEEEARKAEEERQRAEEERRRAEEEARREEERRQAEEEAARRREAEVRRQAEEEAHRRQEKAAALGGTAAAVGALLLVGTAMLAVRRRKR